MLKPNQPTISSFCDLPDAGCVEVRSTPSWLVVTDSKTTDSPFLQFTRTEWEAFTAGVKAGEFDLPETPSMPGSSPVSPRRELSRLS